MVEHSGGQANDDTHAMDDTFHLQTADTSVIANNIAAGMANSELKSKPSGYHVGIRYA
jgi:hypothetical protein